MNFFADAPRLDSHRGGQLFSYDFGIKNNTNAAISKDTNIDTYDNHYENDEDDNDGEDNRSTTDFFSSGLGALIKDIREESGGQGVSSQRSKKRESSQKNSFCDADDKENKERKESKDNEKDKKSKKKKQKKEKQEKKNRNKKYYSNEKEHNSFEISENILAYQANLTEKQQHHELQMEVKKRSQYNNNEKVQNEHRRVEENDSDAEGRGYEDYEDDFILDEQLQKQEENYKDNKTNGMNSVNKDREEKKDVSDYCEEKEYDNQDDEDDYIGEVIQATKNSVSRTTIAVSDTKTTFAPPLYTSVFPQNQNQMQTQQSPITTKNTSASSILQQRQVQSNAKSNQQIHHADATFPTELVAQQMAIMRETITRQEQMSVQLSHVTQLVEGLLINKGNVEANKNTNNINNNDCFAHKKKNKQDYYYDPSTEHEKKAEVSDAITLAGNADNDIPQMLSSSRSLPRSTYSRRDLRHQREHNRQYDLALLEKEEAAHSLFLRLAKDIRQVFQELHMAVIASEKERLIKDEQYRSERAMREHTEFLERQESKKKKLALQEINERNFTEILQNREKDFLLSLKHRHDCEEEDRKVRLRQEVEELRTRMKEETEQRDASRQVTWERRMQEIGEEKVRDKKVYEALLQDCKEVFKQQNEEIREEMDMERGRILSKHKQELDGKEKERCEGEIRMEQRFQEQISMMNVNGSNGRKLEGLIQSVQLEIMAVQNLVENNDEEKKKLMLQEQESIKLQKNVISQLLQDFSETKQLLDGQMTRVMSLYAQFSASIRSFQQELNDVKSQLCATTSQNETLRLQLEKERRSTLQILEHERKLLEKQRQDFLEEKNNTLTEFYAERQHLLKERQEASLIRESHNRDEGLILLNLKQKEDEYQCRLDAIESDREVAKELKEDAKKLKDEIITRREVMNKERIAWEMERGVIRSNWDGLKKRVKETVEEQERLRKELTMVKSEIGKEWGEVGESLAASRGRGGTEVTSQYQLELEKQKTALRCLAGNIFGASLGSNK